MLFQYNDSFFSTTLVRLFTASQVSFLAKQGMSKSKDFLMLRPKRYDVRQYDMTCSGLSMDGSYALIGQLRSISRRMVRKNLTVFMADLMTKNDRIPLTWFNQHYVIDQLKPDAFVVVYGKRDPNHFDVSFQVNCFEIFSSLSAAGDGKIFPRYSDIKGVSNKGLVHLIRTLLTAEHITDMLPASIQSSEGLMPILDALTAFHFPTSQDRLDHAMKRLSFDELMLYMYPRRSRHQRVSDTTSSFKISPYDPLVERYLGQLPYQLTGAQQRVWSNICDDFESGRTVFRLIQGDVGVGKTDIANMSLLAAVASGYQSAMLVPTEILAEQHYLKLSEYCSQLGVSIFLLKGNQRKKDRQMVLEALSSGHSLIVVGTHALVQDSVVFSNLALMVIDEQHRFGVFQRQLLLEKSLKPHCIFMSATPIPRTLMLTHYGDLDHDVIDEVPPGRSPIKTYFGKFNRLKQVHEFIRLALKNGRQAYVVYPLIETSEHLEGVQPAVDGYHELVSVFSDYSVGLLHGQMHPDDKQQIMARFKSNAIQLLVSTTVIEVGVDVPNATIMVIMNAERFGLSQLHQLRGRVGRGSEQAHCFLVAELKSLESKQRIQAMLKTSNGFDLAEEDLNIRGPGNLLGTQQSGDILFSFANVSDQAMVQRVVFWCDQVIKDSDKETLFREYIMSRSVIASELLN